MENYLMLNGQKIELTDSQYKEIMNAIGGSAPTKENPFAKQENEDYYFITSYGMIVEVPYTECNDDDLRYKNANYCSDKDLLRRRAFYEKVERNLWRFSMENGGSGIYAIYFDKQKNLWSWNCWNSGMSFGPTFISYEIALRAINEVLIPLLEKENMDAADLFEWKI